METPTTLGQLIVKYGEFMPSVTVPVLKQEILIDLLRLSKTIESNYIPLEQHEKDVIEAFNDGWNDRGNDDGDFSKYEDGNHYYQTKHKK